MSSEAFVYGWQRYLRSFFRYMRDFHFLLMQSLEATQARIWLKMVIYLLVKEGTAQDVGMVDLLLSRSPLLQSPCKLH